MASLNELLVRLQGDAFRKSHPFSNDIREANELLHNPAAFDDELAECARLWCQTQQPCQFGILAAQNHRIHFSFLTHDAVSNWSDEEIAGKIADDKKLWKQRAAFDPIRAAHSMRAFRQWYSQSRGDDDEWALKLAMVTIDNAEVGKVPGKDGRPPLADGRVTWLRELENGASFVTEIGSPLKSTPVSIRGKDWTKYEGYLHTDHAVRKEFFRERDIPPNIEAPYLMDFTYIYEQNQPDFGDFTRGRVFTEEQVYSEIGTPGEWTHRVAPFPRSRAEAESVLVAEQMVACQRWLQSPRHVVTDA